MKKTMSETKKRPISDLLLCRCPRCREGEMFRSKNPWNLNKTLSMHEECPVCHQRFKLEIGFFLDYGMINCMITFSFSFVTFIVFWIVYGFPLESRNIFYWATLNVIFLLLLVPFIIRISRTLWLAIFVSYDPDWREHTIEQPQRMSNSTI